MKKIYKLLSIVSVAVVALVSCSTSVTVSYLEPAKFNLSDYKKLAIATTEIDSMPIYPDSRIDIKYDNFYDSVFSGYDRRIPELTANYYTDRVFNSMQASNYFDLISPSITNSYLKGLKYGITSSSKLYDMGADALFISSIDSIDYREYPEYGDYILVKNPNFVIGGLEPEYINSNQRKVTIVQVAEIKMSYAILDLLNGSVLASGSYSDSISKDVDYDKFLNLSSQDLFETLASSFVKKTINELIPKKVYKNLSLIENDSKNIYAEQALQLVKDNQLYAASELFLRAWNESRDFASGYNASLLLEALGKRDQAMELMKNVYQLTNSPKALTQYSRMKQYQMSTDQAKTQIEGN